MTLPSSSSENRGRPLPSYMGLIVTDAECKDGGRVERGVSSTWREWGRCPGNSSISHRDVKDGKYLPGIQRGQGDCREKMSNERNPKFRHSLLYEGQ